MTAKERTLWEQAVRVLKQNRVTPTVDTPTAQRQRVTAHTGAAVQRRQGQRLSVAEPSHLVTQGQAHSLRKADYPA